MTKKLVVDSRAASELRDATRQYEEEREGLGNEFSDAVETAFRGLVNGTLRPVTIPGVPNELGIRRLLIKRFPFAIIHIDEVETVYVIAVAHLRRQPLYWRTRITERKT